ncbi:camphor resistance protein CrcB [Anaerohalosphaera lusitana]|uniref:Fluoride-specific ion channel FluC n=1 Tax=Anaerohalosphaera lusitana TaxID=1936003 RepID=A0A1U9NRT8_9BACT|nr:CrcB family protein [Anaerohalosphaera lusitana]AQT70236.1 camphor resistance protein CrcB [Anaerohalosphaera lusitana]
MMQITMIAIAGALGALGRYGAGLWAGRLLGTGFPYGTLIVNVAGCGLIGFFMHVGMTTDWLAREYRTAVTTGFLGALTTFSTFSYETVTHIEDGAWAAAAGNVSLNVVLGLAATFGGLFLARTIVGGA